MKILFFGSSSFSIPLLKALLDSHHQVVAVVTTPSKKKGRGQKESESPVHKFALACSLPCEAPATISGTAFSDRIEEFGADCFVVAAYGKILPPHLLSLPLQYPLNVHPSLLPKYRGASPIASQLLNGETHSGVTIAKIIPAVDAGEIFSHKTVDVQAEDDGVSLSEKLARVGADLLLQVLEQIETRTVTLIQQNEHEATVTKKLNKAMGKIEWNRSASEIHNQVRAFFPWPSAFTFWKGKRVKIVKTLPFGTDNKTAAPGTILDIQPDGFILVQTGLGVIQIGSVQPESGNMMNAHQFAIGHRLQIGEKF